MISKSKKLQLNLVNINIIPQRLQPRWLILISLACFSPYSIAANCIGNCGTLGANGVVTLPPSGAPQYDWISTSQGVSGIGTLPGYNYSTTNGSQLTSDPFYAAKGSKIEFYFNYVTSDGAGYADYSWAQLQSASSNTTIFTARTKPSGSIIPGQDLPPVTAVLNPEAVSIIPGGPVWDPLAGNSGSCYSTGCGYTGWVKSIYTVEEVGTYNLAFGVTNTIDTLYQSGLAFQGLTLNGVNIGDGSSADNALLPSEISPEGSFDFSFTPTPSQPVFIDPLIAVGYDYLITSGNNSITSVLFPLIGGDTDGYKLYTLGDASENSFLGTVIGGDTYNFITPVTGFTVLDIETAALLDPNNPNAFVTGLTFLNGSAVTMSQTPITTNVVPVPASLWLFGSGLIGVIGFRRKYKSE